MKAASNWFEVDKEGLAKILARRGKQYILFELWSNCVDTNAKRVSVYLEPLEGKPYCKLVVVDDDPNGFTNLTHAYTLFAESEKKKDPEKRGRFNLGEKLVLAGCEEASIASTTGTVTFDKQGRHTSSKKTEVGSCFSAIVRMTRKEYAEAKAAFETILVPMNVETTFNGTKIPSRTPLHCFEISLPTEIEDTETGNLRPSRRKTQVRVYEAYKHDSLLHPDEQGILYEMGVPVVATGDKWHVEVMQKVPLNVDRDNVTPAYLKELRSAVLNEMHKFLSPEDTSEAWITEALTHKDVSQEAIEAVLKGRFGEKFVGVDPSDREAENKAKASGYEVIPSRALPGSVYRKARELNLFLPAGRVFPTHSDKKVAPEYYAEDELTEGMVRIRSFALEVGKRLVGEEIYVEFLKNSNTGTVADYGSSSKTLRFVVGSLGLEWFENGITNEVIDLVIHELGHHYEGNHLSTAYYHALTRLGAGMARLALTEPKLFE